MAFSIHDAVKNGVLNALIDARARGWDVMYDTHTFLDAAEARQFDIMKWMINNGYQYWSNEQFDDVALTAVQEKRMDILQWCINEGWDMDSMTFTAAAYEGYLDGMQFMYDNGYTPAEFYASYESILMECDNQESIQWAKSKM